MEPVKNEQYDEQIFWSDEEVEDYNDEIFWSSEEINKVEVDYYYYSSHDRSSIIWCGIAQNEDDLLKNKNLTKDDTNKVQKNIRVTQKCYNKNLIKDDTNRVQKNIRATQKC